MKENPINTIWQSMTAIDPSSIKTAEELKEYMSTPPIEELSSAQQRIYIDWRWKTEQPLLWRAVYRIFRRPIRRIIGAVLDHAFERSIIVSDQLHKMHDIADKVMQPQKPVFFQKP